jgi:hypothetical protein
LRIRKYGIRVINTLHQLQILTDLRSAVNTFTIVVSSNFSAQICTKQEQVLETNLAAHNKSIEISPFW